VQQIGINYYTCNIAEWQMYNITFVNAQHAQVTFNFKKMNEISKYLDDS